MRKLFLLLIFATVLVFSILSSNAYATSYEIGPGDPNQSCEKLGGSFFSGSRFECDIVNSFTLSPGDLITIDPFSRLAIGGGTFNVNGGTITTRSGTVFGNLATFGGTIANTNGGKIDVFGSIASFSGTIDNINGTITNENGASISVSGGNIINEAGGTIVNTGGGDIQIGGGSFINKCGVFINNGQINGGQVQNDCSTTTVLSSSLSTSTSGQQVKFTAIISPSSGTVPDGETITFYKNGTLIGTGTTSGENAIFTTAFANSGTYSITATYPGDSNFPSSTSNAVIQTVTNSPPVANSDSYSINENTVLSVTTATGVLSNDNDPDDDTLTVSLVTGPTHGIFALYSNGSFTFTPNTDFFGTDSFVYQANDGHGNTATATSNINVNQITCDAGSFLLSGSNVCTLAPPGSYVPFPGSTSAIQCDAGTFQPNTGSTSCKPANPGNYVSGTGSTSETQCLVGSYQPNSGASLCIPAPAGSFVSGTGATSSDLCPVGTFTDSVGQSSCEPALAGSFVDTTGATSSTLCLPGSYQSSTGQSSCVLADPGFYVGSSGATQQTQCPAGQSSNAGATSCFVVDTAPPTITITQPTDGSVLDHISSINGTASDDTSVSSVSVSVDGGSPQSAVYSSGTWTLATTLSTGMHTANATATDSVGHKTSTGMTHFTIFASTQGRVTGGGHIGQDQNFGFEVKSDDDHKKSITGHLEYHDKSKKIDLDGKKITSLSVYDSSKHAAFIGQGQIHDKDNTVYSFFVQVYDSDRTGDHDTFSITITDSSGAVIYQNSGVVHGHIEIHKFADKDDKSDSGISHY